MDNTTFTGSASLTARMLCVAVMFALPQIGIANDDEAQSVNTEAEVVGNGSALTVTMENDLFIGEDNQYTNGFGILYSKGIFDQFDASHMPEWMLNLVKKTYIHKQTNKKRGIVYSLAQRMQTPEDIKETELIVEDLPYAGLLIAGLSLYSVDENQSDRLTVGIGVVGPASLARQSQEIVHRATGSEIPLGWSNQLNNEPVFQVGLRRGWRLYSSAADRKLEADVVSFSELTFGNFRSAVSASLIFRLGDNLVTTYATNTLVPVREANTLAYSTKSGWYVYAGLESIWVANDLLIQGNTFSESHSLKLDRRRDRWGAGIGWNHGRWAFSLVYADLTSNGDTDPFGSMSFTRRF